MITQTPRPEQPRRGRTPGVRRGWIVGGGILTAVLLGLAFFQVLGFIARETTIVERTFDAAALRDVRIVEVHSDRGTIEVTGADTDEVRVWSRVSRGLVAPSHRIEVEGDRLVVHSDCPVVLNDHCDVDHELTVPNDLEVVVRSSNGDVRLTDLDGAASVRTQHGDVDLTRLAGALRVEGDMGTVRATQITSPTAEVAVDHGRIELAFDATPTRVSITSSFGDVLVTVPDEPGSFAVTTTTRFGDVRNGLRTDASSGSSIAVDSSFGDVDLRYAP